MTLLIEVAGTGRVEFIEWPPEKKAIDIGSFYASIREVRPRDRLAADCVSCARASARTVDFYRRHLAGVPL